MRNQPLAPRRPSPFAFLLVGLACLAGPGCEEKPAPPPAVVEAVRRAEAAPPVPEEPPRPTTQQIVEGPRHTVALQTVPFTLTVPTSWAVKTDAGRVVLTGPAPRGDVTVLLSPQPLTTAERINLLESGANKEASADPKRYRSAKLTKIGGVQVFERQTAGSTLPGDESATLRWTVTAFAPRPSNQFAPFELNFIGLTVAEYDAHGPFFRGIVESLAYDAGQDTSGI